MALKLRRHRVAFSWRKLYVNRKYKDRLFRFLFREKKDLLALYNAVNGSNYTNSEELEIVTLLIQNKAEVLHMLLTEYNEKRHMKDIFKEGEQSGFAKGEQATLKRQIRKKLSAEKSIETIAAEVETDVETVKKLMEKL